MGWDPNRRVTRTSTRRGASRMARCRPVSFQSPKPLTAFSGCRLSPATSTGSTASSSFAGPCLPAPSGKVFADGAGVLVVSKELVLLKAGVVASHVALEGIHGFRRRWRDPDGSVWVGLRGQEVPLCNVSDRGVTCFGKSDGIRLSAVMSACSGGFWVADRRRSSTGAVVVRWRPIQSRPRMESWPARLAERSGWPASEQSTLGSSDGSASTHQCARVVRASAEPRNATPERVPRKPPPQSPRETQPSQLTHAYERTNAPGRRLWPPAWTTRIAEEREGYRR